LIEQNIQPEAMGGIRKNRGNHILIVRAPSVCFSCFYQGPHQAYFSLQQYGSTSFIRWQGHRATLSNKTKHFKALRYSSRHCKAAVLGLKLHTIPSQA